jgi:Ran GTPase-activating protein (RanGAP) involved in mRNA processing and transport
MNANSKTTIKQKQQLLKKLNANLTNTLLQLFTFNAIITVRKLNKEIRRNIDKAGYLSTYEKLIKDYIKNGKMKIPKLMYLFEDKNEKLIELSAINNEHDSRIITNFVYYLLQGSYNCIVSFKCGKEGITRLINFYKFSYCYFDMISFAVKQDKAVSMLLAKEINKFHSVTFLSIRNNPDLIKYIVSDIGKNKYITKIDFALNEIIPEELKIFTESLINNENKLIKEINLSNNYLSPDAMKSINDLLIKNSCIEVLDFSGNYIGDEGCKNLDEGIKQNHSLKDLNLSHNNITNTGADYLSNSLKWCKTLKSLNIIDNSISDKEIQKLVNSLHCKNIIN